MKKKVINERFYELIWVFIIGCIIGSFFEILLNYVKFNTIESRSALVFGQFNPIYGVGAVLFSIILKDIKDNKKIILYCALIGMGFEYFCSFIQEKAFGTVSWNYSKYLLNLNGRTSIFHGICWGIIGLSFIKLLYPHIVNFSKKLNNSDGKIITWSIVIFLIFDSIISVCAAIRQKERIKSINDH